MKNKLILSLIVGIFLINLIGIGSAETETYKVNTPTNLQFTCTLNDEIPTAATFNITITDREGNYLVNNQETEDQGNGAFNYTVIFTKAEKYKIKMFCYDGTYSYSDEGFYNITGNGFSDNYGFYLLIFGLSAGIIIFGFAIKDYAIVILGSFGLFFIGLYILFNGINGMKDSVYTWGIGIIILGVAFYLSARASLELLE
jgi:hypothetical protein